MSVVKIIEIIGSSEKGFDDAVRNVVEEVSQTVRNIDSVFIKDFKVHIKDNKIISFGAICKVAFRVDEENK